MEILVLAVVAGGATLTGVPCWSTVCPSDHVPGTFLLGERASDLVIDWSFADNVELCQIQISTGWQPHALNLNCMATPEGKLRLNGLVYPVTVTRVTDPAELDVAWRARVRTQLIVGAASQPSYRALAMDSPVHLGVQKNTSQVCKGSLVPVMISPVKS